MSEKLKPCPFCGGEALNVEWVTPHDEKGWAVACKNPECLMNQGARIFLTEAEAVEVWNRRAERAEADIEREVVLAKMGGTPLQSLTEEQKDMVRPYVERTCKMHDASMSTHTVWACSSCGEDIAPQFPGTFNYCPNCGARVVDE